MIQRNDMQVNVAGLRRNIKNIAHNYSDAQVKVREATSNDPWGPSSTLMAEIADLTYNVVAFTEIMQMIWKRLNDHGRNWRHVYKALVLLEYLIKTGTEKVAQQCKENIFAIQTLKDFQHLEEGKDQGLNVREKAKQLVALLKDDERLRNERARALKAKERFAQTASGFGSDGQIDTPTSPKYPAWDSSPSSGSVPAGELENARPQTAGEEELQLQLALAMSREEAEQDAARRRSDQVRLQLALSQSQNDFQANSPDKPSNNVVDLLDGNSGDTASGKSTDPWGMPVHQPPQKPQMDPWSVSTNTTPTPIVDPWAPVAGATAAPITGAIAPPITGPVAISTGSADPWRGTPTLPPPQSTKRDPWAPVGSPVSSSSPLQSNTAVINSGLNSPPRSTSIASPTVGLAGLENSVGGSSVLTSPSSDLDEFDIITNRNLSQRNGNMNKPSNGSTASPDPFDLYSLGDALSLNENSSGAVKKTPQSFLGENSALVNLDNLVTLGKTPPCNNSTTPPFNPFAETIQPKPSMNQIKQQSFTVQSTSTTQSTTSVQDPWAPVNTTQQNQATWMKPFDQPNPFLS